MLFYRFSKSPAFFSIVLALFFTFPSYATFDHDVPNPCLDAVPVALDSTTRSFDSLDAASRYIRVDVPSAGLLSVSASAGHPAVLGVEVAWEGCAQDSNRNIVIVEKSAKHLVASIRRSGSYLFHIASDATAQHYESKIRTAFVPESTGTNHTDVGEDEDEIEVEPDPLAHSDTSKRFVTKRKGTTHTDVGEDEDEIEVEPDPLRGTDLSGGFAAQSSSTTHTDVGEDEDEIEVEPDPLRGPGLSVGETLNSKLQRLCRLSNLDDHGDVSTCATFLTTGQETLGELRNGWGDDEDAFTFVVGEARGLGRSAIEIVITGEVDLAGGLYNRQGQRLEWKADRSVRFNRTLEPGIYFVRVVSLNGEEGYYSLSVNTVGR